MTVQAVRFSALACLILLVHAALVVYTAYSTSPVVDEPGHLVSGIHHWRSGTFRLYSVNPPLVRMVAALPMFAMEHRFPRIAEPDEGYTRPEYLAADHFADLNGDRLYSLVLAARLACIPISLLGAVVCFLWASRMYGPASGYMALILWCVSPFTVGHGALLTPDVGGAATGVLACYAFWEWLIAPSWRLAALSGLALGLALLAKTTLMLLVPIFPVIWLATLWRRGAPAGPWRPILPTFGQLAAMIAIAFVLLNAGYGFEGTGRKLGGYSFDSRALFGDEGTYATGGNRFRGSWLAEVPVPLPEYYIRGIDLQRFDFEKQSGSYLLGQWREEGWWHYYVVGLAVKEPLALWALALLAVVLRWRFGLPKPTPGEFVLWLPAAAIFLLVSSQTGMNHHVRYVMPVLPLLYIGVSQVAATAARCARWCTVVVWALVTWYVVSSLAVVPYSISYFNELAGGPDNGRLVLHNSSTDWGQGLFALKEWHDDHPEARPLHVKSWMRVSTSGRLGMEWHEVPILPLGAYRYPVEDWLPEPGWYAINVGSLHDRGGLYDYFFLCKPHAQVAHVWMIYHITEHDRAQIRTHYSSAPASTAR
ncbi:MAG TPA: glycosyltransferase family 39 protein [Pirellulaceae bacterium]|nr:glycosyltransferase family 39 protein [Pirellulaceae bacterium]